MTDEPFELFYSSYVPLQAENCQHLYTSSDSVMGNEILAQILVTLVQQLAVHVEFKLVTQNTLFLDETWVLPVRKEFLFVPSDTLGLQIS